MSRVDGIIFDEYKANLINKLHKAGIAQIEFLEDKELDDMALERDRPLEKVIEVSNLLLRIRKLLDTLQRFDVRNVPFLESMLNIERIEKIQVGELSIDEVIKETNELIEGIEEGILNADSSVQRLESKITETTDLIEKYSLFKGLEIRLEDIGESTYLYKIASTLKEESIPSLKERLSKSFKDEYMLILGGEMQGKILAIIVVMKERKDELNAFLREFGIDQIQVTGEGYVLEILKGMEDELKRLRHDVEESKKGLEGNFQNHYKRMLALEELLSLEKDRAEIFIRFGRTNKTTMLRLWVPQEKSKETIELINKETDGACILNVDNDPDEAPILLQNPKPLNSFEMLTKLFSLPRYKEIDPTLFMIPTFVLFFGIMMTDVVYGVILIIAALLLRKKYGKISPGAKDMSTIFVGCGIAAIVMGILTGSYMGDFLGKYILGKSSQEIALWMDPMYEGNSLTVLIAVCVMGFLHVYFGHLLGMYDKLRNKQVKEAIQQNLSWYILFFGLLMAIVSYFNLFPLPGFVLWVGVLLVLISFTLLYMHFGFLFFTDVIGVVGNVLSYARLLAMALTTSGIAMSFNFLASMAIDIPWVGIPLAAVVFISGHVINILINSLGAFVHSIRLHYVEHFGTYYVGGGKEFQPFMEERRYSY